MRSLILAQVANDLPNVVFQPDHKFTSLTIIKHFAVLTYVA